MRARDFREDEERTVPRRKQRCPGGNKDAPAGTEVPRRKQRCPGRNRGVPAGTKTPRREQRCPGGNRKTDEKTKRVRELQNLSVSENGIDPNDTIAGLIRSKQNRNCVRWYVLTLPISRKGFYCGDPAKKLIAEMDRRSRNGEKTFEFFAPSYVEVAEKNGTIEMENLKWVFSAYGYEIPVLTPGPGRLAKGDRVRIIDGKFKGVEATVVARSGAGCKNIVVCIENCMYVPLIAVKPGQYEVIELNGDNGHIYARMNNDRIFTKLHEAILRLHDGEITDRDRGLAKETLLQFGNLMFESVALRCKLYAMLLQAYAILGHSENFNALLTTIRNFLPLINSEYAKALLLVAAYGCSDNARFHDLAHEIVDPWRKTDPVKKNKCELIRRLDDYDRTLTPEKRNSETVFKPHIKKIHKTVMDILSHVFITFLISAILVGWIHPKIVQIAILKNIVDKPDARKLQRQPVPVLGGVAVPYSAVSPFSSASSPESAACTTS